MYLFNWYWLSSLLFRLWLTMPQNTVLIVQNDLYWFGYLFVFIRVNNLQMFNVMEKRLLLPNRLWSFLIFFISKLLKNIYNGLLTPNSSAWGTIAVAIRIETK